MSEDWHLADDEETSPEIVVQGLLNPVPVSPPAQKADIDDIFEGEPDSTLFASSDFDHTEAISTLVANDEAGANLDCDNSNQQCMYRSGLEETSHVYKRQELSDPDHTTHSNTPTNYAPPTVESDGSSVDSLDGLSPTERPQSIFAASGGLGPGDTPYDKILSFERPDDSQRQAWQQHHLTPDSWSPYVRAHNALRQRYDHLEELSGENTRPQGRHNYTYSPSASSESVSEDDEGGGGEQKHAARRSPLPHHALRTESSKPADSAQQGKAQSKSQDNDRDGSIVSDSHAGNTHSSLLHSWPHLSNVTPADVQGHHPSIIARSPRKGMSRASSLASEGGFDAPEQVPPLTEAALPETDIISITEDPKIFQSPFSYMKVEPHSRFVADNGLSSPFRRAAANPSTSSNQSSPLRRPVDSTDAASTFAVTESPMPLLSAVPSRPDTPRPSTELEEPGTSHWSYVQPVNRDVHVPNPLTLYPHGTFLSDWTQPGHNMHDAVSATPLPPRLVDPLCSVHGTTAQGGSHTVLRTSADVARYVSRPVTPPLASPLRSQTISDDSPQLNVPLQACRVVPGVLECHYPRARSKNSSRVSPHSDTDTTSELFARESPGTIKGPSDPISKDTGSTDSAAPLGEDSPLSSPPNGLHDAIRAKRGSRKATAPRRKFIKDPTSTRGRAVSLSPKKEKTGTTNSNAPATGVQGECIKVTKTRPKRPAQIISRKATTSKDKSKTSVGEVPEVPDLPEGLLLDASELLPQRIKLNFSVHRCKTEEGSSNMQSAPSRTDTGTKEGFLPQAPVEGPATPPSTHKQQLKVPKTRRIGPCTKTILGQREIDSITKTVETPEHTHMEIDSISPVREPDTSQEEPQEPDRRSEPTTPSTKRFTATRKQTPGRIQKATVQKPKPAHLLTHRPNQIADILETDGHVIEQPERPPRTLPTKTKTKTKATLRKATPAPVKRRQLNKASDEVIPPVPETPQRTNKNSAMDVEGRLTPQSAERGHPKTPQRRSPRLSGIEPGKGL